MYSFIAVACSLKIAHLIIQYLLQKFPICLKGERESNFKLNFKLKLCNKLKYCSDQETMTISESLSAVLNIQKEDDKTWQLWSFDFKYEIPKVKESESKFFLMCTTLRLTTFMSHDWGDARLSWNKVAFSKGRNNGFQIWVEFDVQKE